MSEHRWVIPRFGTEDEHVCRYCRLYATEPGSELPCRVLSREEITNVDAHVSALSEHQSLPLRGEP